MEIDRKYKLEKAVSKDPNRITLKNIHVSRRHARATNGSILAIVPIESSKNDTSGWLTPDALKLGRKATPNSFGNVRIELNGAQVFTDGTSIPRPTEEKPPNIFRLLLDAHRNRKVKFGINASYLKDLADAIGTEEVVLEFSKPDKAILVRPQSGKDGAVGLIMPVRINS